MAKPFSIQAPEDIAKDYAGNKQMIAQAAQMGVVDPTAAVLAGMFIDRMRSAQVMEAAQQPTVAQQVLGGGGSPMPSPQGLGANPAMPPPPPNMPPMAAPQMAPPQAPQEMAPQGMAMGGVASLPIPDAMFDEPMNGGFGDGYAGGGLVAFAGGGTSLGPWFEQTALGAIPGIGVTSRQRSAAQNQKVGGVPDSYHQSDNARDFVPPKGMSMGQLASSLQSLFGKGYDIINEGDHVHVEPGPRSDRMASSPAREADTATAAGRFMSAEDSMAFGRRVMGDMPRGELDRARQYALEELDPVTQEKRVKADMWQTLAEIGFNMASSKSPYVLQAIGEAASAAMPGARADKKERKAAKDTAVRTLMAVEDVDRKTAMMGVELGMDVYKTGMSAEQAERALTAQKDENALDRALQREIEKSKAARTPTSDLETMIAIQQYGTPEQKAALVKTLELKQQYATRGESAGSLEGVLGLGGSGGGEGDPYAGFSATRN